MNRGQRNKHISIGGEREPNKELRRNNSSGNIHPPLKGKFTTPNTHRNNSREKQKQLNEQLRRRIIFLFANFIGQNISVQLKNGKVYEGLFETVRIVEQEGSKDQSKNVLQRKEYELIISMAREMTQSNRSTRGEQAVRKEHVKQVIIETLLLDSREVVKIEALNIVFASEKEQYRDKTFIIDSQITCSKDKKERDLVPWKPSDEEQKQIESNDFSLDDDSGYTKGWNQYKENAKFGVQSTYDEDFYTTPLDRTSDHYKLNEGEAEKIAKEIESEPVKNGNVHIAEERGLNVQTNLTEEELYSSVDRKNIPKETSTIKKDKPNQKQTINTKTSKSRIYTNSPQIVSPLDRLKVLPKSLSPKASPLQSPTSSPLSMPRNLDESTKRVNALSLDSSEPKVPDDLKKIFYEAKEEKFLSRLKEEFPSSKDKSNPKGPKTILEAFKQKNQSNNTATKTQQRTPPHDSTAISQNAIQKSPSSTNSTPTTTTNTSTTPVSDTSSTTSKSRKVFKFNPKAKAFKPSLSTFSKSPLWNKDGILKVKEEDSVNVFFANKMEEEMTKGKPQSLSWCAPGEGSGKSYKDVQSPDSVNPGKMVMYNQSNISGQYAQQSYPPQVMLYPAQVYPMMQPLQMQYQYGQQYNSNNMQQMHQFGISPNMPGNAPPPYNMPYPNNNNHQQPQ